MITLESEEDIPQTIPALNDAVAALLANLVPAPPPSESAPLSPASSAAVPPAPASAGKQKEVAIPTIPPSESQPINLFASLYAYFLEHNPDKIVDIPCLVRRFDNREGALHRWYATFEYSMYSSGHCQNLRRRIVVALERFVCLCLFTSRLRPFAWQPAAQIRPSVYAVHEQAIQCRCCAERSSHACAVARFLRQQALA